MEHDPPPSSFYLNTWTSHAHAYTFTCTHSQTRTYTSRGIMGTSGGAHPMHRQTFPGVHQRSHQRGFKQPATANTNTHTHTYIRTHLLTAEVKAKSDEQRNSERLFALEVIAALQVNSLSTRADFHLHWSSIHVHIFMYISPWQGPRPTRTQRKPSCIGSFS